MDLPQNPFRKCFLKVIWVLVKDLNNNWCQSNLEFYIKFCKNILPVVGLDPTAGRQNDLYQLIQMDYYGLNIRKSRNNSVTAYLNYLPALQFCPEVVSIYLWEAINTHPAALG